MGGRYSQTSLAGTCRYSDGYRFRQWRVARRLHRTWPRISNFNFSRMTKYKAEELFNGEQVHVQRLCRAIVYFAAV